MSLCFLTILLKTNFMQFIKFPFGDGHFLCVGEIYKDSDYWIYLLILATETNLDVWKFDNSGIKEIQLNGCRYLMRPLAKFLDNEATQLLLRVFAINSEFVSKEKPEDKSNKSFLEIFKNLF